MLPIRLLGPTEPFTPLCFLRIAERDGILMLADNEIDIPNAPIMGIQMKVEFEGKRATQHFLCALEEGFFRAVDPLISLDISDLREACSVKVEDTYRWLVLHQAENLSGLKIPGPDGIEYPRIESLADLRKRIGNAW